MGAFLLAGSAAFGLSNRHDEQSRTDQRLSTSAGAEATQVEEYFERARSIILLTAHNPAFRAFYQDSGARLAKIHARTPHIRDSEAGLAYIEQLYAASISEVCFIDRGGAENARYVDGVRAPFGQLSQNESKNPFFTPTFALRPGQVYQARPYVSPDTKTWVISNSTPVGVAVTGTLRSSDFAGRHGGEEFILLLPDTDGASAVVVAEKLRLIFASVEVPGVPRPITASFGVATMPKDGTEPSALLRTADRALYLAKAGGRNRVEMLATEPVATAEVANGRPTG